jgi:hypothetical protein
MIRSSIHTPRTFTAIPAGVNLRPGLARDASVWMGLDQAKYQPETGGLCRTGQQT